MNRNRRNEISKISTRVADLSAALASLLEDIETVRDDEQEAYDNLPESLQESERGESMNAAIEALSEATDEIDGMIETASGVESSLETAQE